VRVRVAVLQGEAEGVKVGAEAEAAAVALVEALRQLEMVGEAVEEEEREGGVEVDTCGETVGAAPLAVAAPTPPVGDMDMLPDTVPLPVAAAGVALGMEWEAKGEGETLGLEEPVLDVQAVALPLPEAAALPVVVGERRAERECVREGVREVEAVKVREDAKEGVREVEGQRLPLGEREGVALGVADGVEGDSEGVAVAETEPLGVIEGEAVAEVLPGTPGLTVGERVAVQELEGDLEGVGEGVPLAVPVGVPVGVRGGVAVALGVAVGDCERVLDWEEGQVGGRCA
jgi:hypothetical protein